MYWLTVRGNDTPSGPSGPVEIGTGGTHHGHAEAGSWQTLILMFIAVILIGAAVLMYVVRQRRKLLERRRLRRIAEAARRADREPHADPSASASASPSPDPHRATTTSPRFRSKPAGPERVT
jgi:hypothetical protein